MDRSTGRAVEAAYVNYAMHPVNGYLVGITSADFCGAASRWVGRAFGDDMVMVFTQGASGDQNPLALRTGTDAMASKSGVEITGYELVREDVEAPLRSGKVPHGKLDPEVADRLMRWIDAQGILLGEEVIRVMSDIRPTAADVRIWGAQEMLACPGRQRTDSGREGAPGIYEDGDPVNIRLGVLGVGDTAPTSVNGEVYTPIWQRLRRQSPMANTQHRDGDPSSSNLQSGLVRSGGDRRRATPGGPGARLSWSGPIPTSLWSAPERPQSRTRGSRREVVVERPGGALVLVGRGRRGCLDLGSGVSVLGRPGPPATMD